MMENIVSETAKKGEILKATEEKVRVYKAKLHIATGPFSYMEVEVEDTMPEIIKKSEWLLKAHENKQK